MKKIFFAVLLCVSIFSAGAMSDFAGRTFCAGLSFPYMRHDYRISGMDAVTLSGIGLNLNYRQMREEMKIGLFLDSDLFMPFSKTVALDERISTTTHFSDYDYFFGIDVLVGIYTVLFRDETFNFPIGAGFHLDGFISKQSYEELIIKESVYTLGLGGWLNAEIIVTKRLGMYAGAKVLYDFYYKLNNKAATTTAQDGRSRCFSLIPAVGFLWRFD